MKNNPHIYTAALLCALVGSSVSTVRAADATWLGGDGLWSDGAKWSTAAPPLSTERVVWGVAGSFTTTLTEDAEAYEMRYSSGTIAIPSITFDMGGHVLTLTSSEVGNASPLFGSASEGADARTMNFQNGEFIVKTFTMSSGSTQPLITFNVQNSGTFTTGDAAAVPELNVGRVGFQGQGSVYVRAGSTWNAHSKVSLGSSGGIGLVNVNGSGASYSAFTANATGARDWVITSVGDSGTGTFQVQGGATSKVDNMNLSNAVSGSGTLLVDGTGSTLTARNLYVGGGADFGSRTPTAKGTGAATISNSGVVNLGRAIIFAGGTVTLNGGTVNITTDFGSSDLVRLQGGLLTGNGTVNGTVQLDSASTITGSGGTLNLSALTVGTGGSGFNGTIGGGTVSVSGATVLAANMGLIVNGTLSGAGSLTLNAGSQLMGTGTINKTGGTISGAGTVGGSVTTALSGGAITGGVFTNGVSASNSAISGGTYNSTLTLSNGSTIAGLTLANGLTIDGLGATVSSGTTTANGTTTVNDGATLTVNGTLAGSGDLSFQSSNAAGIAGTGTVSKAVSLNGNKTLSSSGTLLLGSTLGVSGTGNAISSGTVSAGATTINSGGALAVNGTLSGSSGLAVNGLLSGSGTISKAVSVNSGGTLSPGNSPGNLSMSSLDLAAGGNYNWQVYDATGVAGTGFDTTTVSGVLDLTELSISTKYAINLWSLSSIGPDVNGNAINFDNALTQSWVLIDAGSINLTGLTNPITDYFSVITAASNGTNGFSNTMDGVFAVGTNGNNLVLNYTAVPEPSTSVLLGIGLAVMLYRGRSKRAQ